MKGLDTNVLIRLLVDDNPKQRTIAEALAQEAEENGQLFFISTVVLCEAIWTLEGKRYRLDRNTVAGILDQILATAIFEVQDRGAVRAALAAFVTGPADFADYLIGIQAAAAGCSETYSFDKSLSATEGFRVLASG